MATAFSLTGVDTLLLFSDGLAWALDDFGLTDLSDLLTGWTPLGVVAGLLRSAERADPAHTRVLRGKTSDDTTGLRLRLR